MDVRERQILYCVPRSGPPPFRVWFERISDRRARLAVTARIARLRGGNFGDSRPIGEGASENRIDFGPGYRLYYAVDDECVILLCGGDKSTQSRDIARAKALWRDYKEIKGEQSRRLQSRSSRGTKERP